MEQRGAVGHLVEVVGVAYSIEEISHDDGWSSFLSRKETEKVATVKNAIIAKFKVRNRQIGKDRQT